ncbi:alpha-ketoacid dehydrogenase subunit alpha/beta [Crystallibacter degradans]|uniref:alpha-ketoacid dehydrogenase subunit alpha/beta n=1 Tax=Crystallibacter degradans TaxID=2726743 RepID=UPI00147454C1|nr:alpha-ketoacid dehydrogenase subunit alpha/beta [Arthrobacter sp. SF27]NMR30530.1 transketolase [Arthrobacter sp. SF27]
MSTLNLFDTYRQMLTIRQLEERVQKISLEGEVAGSVHLCLGQEAIPVGTAAALRPQDRILSTYRGHGWALAAGSDPLAILAEIAQRTGGTNGGRAGSPLLSDPANGFIGENSIVGAGIPIGAGVALAAKSRGEDRVVISSIGDGAMNQGGTTEGMIFAAAKNLPIIFICENNGWAEMTTKDATTRNKDLASRGEGLGIQSHVVDGNDPEAVHDAVAAAIEVCTRGEGPVLLECKTARLSGHYNRDIQHYRSKEDQASATAADPLPRLRRKLIDAGTTETELAAVEEQVSRLIDDITDQTLAMPGPDKLSVYEHLYAPSPEPVAVPKQLPETAREMTYQRAINQALSTELENRPELLVYGEDVGFAGGIFGVSRGLQKKFGEERVFDTPIAESAILGSAVGAAMEGMRPVVEIMWADFVFVALDQIINQASNVRYINQSRLSAPLTIRMQQGATPGSCAQHSQSIEAILAHIPGIKVGLPATAQDAYAMTRAAIADEDPTVLVEARSLYQVKGMVDTDAPTQTAAGARFHRHGSDLAIITWGDMVTKANAAAEQLAAEGIDTTVLDLRWLRPLDESSIARAVAEAGGHVLVVHEAHRTGGFGAEVAAGITERHFAELSAPVSRIGTADVRIPSAPALQDAVLPGTDSIIAAARNLLGAAKVGAL